MPRGHPDPRLTLPVLALFASMMVPSVGGAYVRAITSRSKTPMRWIDEGCIELRANSRGSDDIDDGSDLEALARAVDNWHRVIGDCSFIRFAILPATPGAQVQHSRTRGANETTVIWVEEGWQRDVDHDASAVALTKVWHVNDPDDPEDGRITDADIELNGEFVRFSTSGERGRADVENTLTHELGHVLGLDHTCFRGDAPEPLPSDDTGAPLVACTAVAVGAEVRAATMFPSTTLEETIRRSPEPDDVSGVCATYPLSADPGQRCGDDGGCGCRQAAAAAPAAAIAGGVIVALLPLLALGVIRTLRRGRRRGALVSRE